MGSDIFGALFASVSGLDAQSTNLSIIANNIANANTIGYKATQAEFETLVSGTGSSTSYASGGVTADNRQLVDQQGLLQSTSSPTDLAIQGNGLFVVNSAASGNGDVLYTRAGSFTQDNLGNFVNSAGYYLQAWPLNSNGLLPGAPGNTSDTTSSANLSSLQTVNVENVAGKAEPTTTVSISANLNASQTEFPGTAATVDMDEDNSTDFGVSADETIIPDPTIDSLAQGDEMTISTSSNTTGYVYQYGGIAYSRSVVTGAADGNSATALQSPVTSSLTTDAITFNAATPTTMTINLGTGTPAGAGITTAGQVIALSGTASNGLAVNNITTLDGNYYVTSLGAHSVTVTIPATITPPSAMSLTGATVTTTAGNPDVVITNIANVPAGLADGDLVTFTGLENVGGLTITGTHTYAVSSVTTGAGGSVTFDPALGNASNANYTVPSTDDATMFDTYGDLTAASMKVTSRLFTGDILDATSPTTSFLTSTSAFTTAALSFTITTATTGTSTFTYTSSSPNEALGQFNNLDNLATAISDVDGLSARVVNNQLYVSAVNGDDAITFANGSITGTNDSPPQAGINWVGELGLANIPIFSTSGVQGRFSTLQGLANLVNETTDITATVSNPLGASTLAINVDSPLDTITFTDSATGHTNTGSLLAELGLVSSLDGTAYSTPQTTGALGPAYSATDSAKNMASGAITPQFSREITVYDSLGVAHSFNIGFINTGTNTWAVEVYAQPASDIDQSSLDGTSGSDNTGLVAYGAMTFNGDGSLASMGPKLSNAIPVEWEDGAQASSITINWGTAGPVGTGKTNGMGQFSSPYNVNFVNQNGAQVGDLTGVTIGTTGIITATFSNGQTQALYQIPVAIFTDPDELQSNSGNVYSQTSSSGQVNLQQAGGSNVGTIVASSLEQSNVELADQLTTMIVAQQAYQANTKVISTADNLLTSLDQIFQ